MSMISDKVTMRLNRIALKHGVLNQLRMGPNYGHGFLGLFNALFHGDLEDVINDPGPPFLDPKEAKEVANCLINFCEASGIKIPHRNRKYKTSSIDLNNCSKDPLFE